MKKSAYRKWIFPVLMVFLLVVTFIIRKYKKQETEYSIMQAVIEKLPDYQNEIEGWGYQVSVLPKMTGEPERAGLMRYYLESADPVLILEDQDASSKDRYDVSVLIEITAESLEDGNEVSVIGGGFFETNYCSNNFEECCLWNGIDPTSTNSYFDHNIKQEYSVAQLLGYYRKGLELQKRLIELYRERQEEDGR